MKTMIVCTRNVLLVAVSLLLSVSVWADNNKKQEAKALAGAPQVIVVPAEIKPSQMVTLTSSGALCPSSRGNVVDLALDTTTAERFAFFIPAGEALVLTQFSHYGSGYLYLEAGANFTPLMRLTDGITQLSDTVVGAGAVLCYTGGTSNSYKNLILQGHLVKNN